MRGYDRLRRSWIPALVLIAACGGGGGGHGEDFVVPGLWSVNGTSTPGTPSPAEGICATVASATGNLPATTLNVTRDGSAVTANEVGSPLAFTGTADDATQSFSMTSTTPICQTVSGCTVCGSVGVDFLNAAGNDANVDVAFAFTGNSRCPVQCTIAFHTTGTRS
jgi:hypothetical protein